MVSNFTICFQFSYAVISCRWAGSRNYENYSAAKLGQALNNVREKRLSFRKKLSNIGRTNWRVKMDLNMADQELIQRRKKTFLPHIHLDFPLLLCFCSYPLQFFNRLEIRTPSVSQARSSWNNYKKPWKNS